MVCGLPHGVFLVGLKFRVPLEVVVRLSGFRV